MRVLHCIGEMGPGGAESLVVEMARRGESFGWASAIASSGGSKLSAVSAAARHYRVPLARRRAGGVLIAAAATGRAISSFRPDVIVAHNVGASVNAGLARLISCRWRTPLVTVFHGVAEPDYRLAVRLLNRSSDHVVCVCSAIHRRLTNAGLSVGATVIPNAISSLEVKGGDQVRMDLGLDDAPVALCLARLVDQKRHDVLLRAWVDVPYPARLLLAGEGPLRPQLERLATELGVVDRISFLGARDDAPAVLAAADITCLASDWEGLPIAILESMGAGRPVVATNVDGVAEAVTDGAGILVPPRDAGRLASAMKTLLFDDVARAAASQAALEVIATRYDPATMMHSYDRLFALCSSLGSRKTRSRLVIDS